MSDAALVLDAIHKDAQDLDQISKRLYEANQRLDQAEEAWEHVFDQVMADLEEEFGAAGRKSVPEHTAVSAARRANRLVYTEWRQAKRELERLQQQLKAKTAALNGRQSELRALADEDRATRYGTPQGGQVIGGVRAV